MQLDPKLPPALTRAAQFNTQVAGFKAQQVLHHALTSGTIGRIAMVSSFGADSVVLLHMLSQIDSGVPVLFIDTEMLFPQTLEYQRALAEHLNLNVQVIRPDRADLLREDVDGILHKFDTDACCALRKVRPLETALQGYDAWITGRKRFHGGQRDQLEFFEADGSTRIKVNPLAHYTPADVATYIDTHKLPRHKLVAKGYPSLGCTPCTSKARPDEDPRAGRWRGTQKEECGIHFINGKMVRSGGAV